MNDDKSPLVLQIQTATYIIDRDVSIESREAKLNELIQNFHKYSFNDRLTILALDTYFRHVCKNQPPRQELYKHTLISLLTNPKDTPYTEYVIGNINNYTYESQQFIKCLTGSKCDP